MINSFIFITTQPTLATLLSIIDFCFCIIGPYGVFFFFAGIRRHWFFHKVSLSVASFSHMQFHQFFAWNISTIVFLSISISWFLWYFCLFYDTITVTRTYIQQLCEDTGCSPEDLPEAMNDREKWRESVRDDDDDDDYCYWLL